MAALSDRSLFFEMIKTTPMTVNDIIEKFGVARNTARNWAKHEEVEKIAGSYPTQYRRKNSFAEEIIVPTPTKTPRNNPNLVELPEVPENVVSKFFYEIVDHEAKTFNFNEELRYVDLPEDLDKLEHKLKVAMVVVRYARKVLNDGGRKQ